MEYMKRKTISIPEELDEQIMNLRKTDKYYKCSYGEIVRDLLIRGLSIYNRDFDKEKTTNIG